MTDDPFERLRLKYREQAAGHVATLEQALAAGDRRTVANIAHKLHGNGASLGFPQVSIHAQPVEAAAEEGLANEGLWRLAEPLLSELTQIAQTV